MYSGSIPCLSRASREGHLEPRLAKGWWNVHGALSRASSRLRPRHAMQRQTRDDSLCLSC